MARKFLNKKTLTIGALALGAYFLYFRKPKGSVAGLGFSFGKARRGIADALKNRIAVPPPSVPLPATPGFLTKIPGNVFTTMPVKAPAVTGNVISLTDRLRQATQRSPGVANPFNGKKWGTQMLRPFGK